MRLVRAEDHVLLRDGLVRLSAHDFTVVEAVDNAPKLHRLLRDDSVDTAVVDVRVPPTLDRRGAACGHRGAPRPPRFPGDGAISVRRAVVRPRVAVQWARVRGYLLKDRIGDIREFIDGLRWVVGGGTVLDPEVVATLMARQGQTPIDRLTTRERDVLDLMAQGRSNASVAAALFVSDKAVAKHIASIFTKLDLPVDVDDNRRVRAVLTWLRV